MLLHIVVDGAGLCGAAPTRCSPDSTAATPCPSCEAAIERAEKLAFALRTHQEAYDGRTTCGLRVGRIRP